MKLEISTIKGFRDYLPPESLKRMAIKKIIEKYYKLYGFLPVETPVIEFDELMRSDSINPAYQDEAVSERFRLRDRGGRDLGLRYEFTFQLARTFKENPNIKLPFKRYQIGENFRDEPLRAGRTRQFTQCDADIIGDPFINADAECLALASDILKELNISNIEIQINNRKLINSIIESIEIKEIKEIMRELDKIEKLGTDVVKANLKKYTSTNQVITLFKLLEKNLSFFLDNAFEGSEELDDLINKCKLYGIKTRFNPSMVRGFSYYTGNIFEIVISDRKLTLIAGGRYDKTVGKYIGREIPAVGISFSLEALMDICENEIAKLPIELYPKVLIISFNQEEETIKLARKLRKNNISCTTIEGQPSKALDFANSQKIPFVIFLGEEEIEKNKFKLKEMSSGEEKFLSEKQLIGKLKK